MKIGIAPDSFKGNMTALQVATRIEKGLRKALGDITVVKVPMADGGDGTAKTIVDATGGRMVRRTVSGPLGKPVRASFGLSGDGHTAVIEMAEASGLALLRPSQRNPMRTTTRGTGELISHALKLGVSHLLVGIGGSATTDGGMGMARALGVRFLDKRGREVADNGRGLLRVASIDMTGLDPRLEDVRVEVACDVDNPLTGLHGAAQVYGPQKGATPEMVEQLDAGLENLADVIKRDLGKSVLKVPGSGAAGGLGAGLLAFLHGELRPGIAIVIDAVQLAKRLKGCDLVITGEGRMDGQTAFGKTPAGVAGVAKSLGLPVIALAGCLGPGVSKVHKIGIDAYFSTLERSINEDEIPVVGPTMLTNCAEQVGRVIAMKGALNV
ncbi:MAG: glycerate kinase [Kiritimatiellae bacterium]|nr:glycerate kinase [Kiritimatiellia bacterium]